MYKLVAICGLSDPEFITFSLCRVPFRQREHKKLNVYDESLLNCRCTCGDNGCGVPEHTAQGTTRLGLCSDVTG
jgi:hypothetical protein